MALTGVASRFWSLWPQILQLHLLKSCPRLGQGRAVQGGGSAAGGTECDITASAEEASQPAGTGGRHGRAELIKCVSVGAGAAAARSGRGLRGGGARSVDVSTIVADAEAAVATRGGPTSIDSRGATPREIDSGFVDDDDEVPPLM
jgi:hypothetical protein